MRDDHDEGCRRVPTRHLRRWRGIPWSTQLRDRCAWPVTQPLPLLPSTARVPLQSRASGMPGVGTNVRVFIRGDFPCMRNALSIIPMVAASLRRMRRSRAPQRLSSSRSWSRDRSASRSISARFAASHAWYSGPTQARWGRGGLHAEIAERALVEADLVQFLFHSAWRVNEARSLEWRHYFAQDGPFACPVSSARTSTSGCCPSTVGSWPPS